MIIYTIAEKCVCDAVDDDASLENRWQQKQVRLNEEITLPKFIDYFFQNLEYRWICIFINKKIMRKQKSYSDKQWKQHEYSMEDSPNPVVPDGMVLE